MCVQHSYWFYWTGSVSNFRWAKMALHSTVDHFIQCANRVQHTHRLTFAVIIGWILCKIQWPNIDLIAEAVTFRLIISKDEPIMNLNSIYIENFICIPKSWLGDGRSLIPSASSFSFSCSWQIDSVCVMKFLASSSATNGIRSFDKIRFKLRLLSAFEPIN